MAASTRRHAALAGVFVLGAAGLAAALGLGLYQSISIERRLPVLSLTDVLDTYLVGIDELIREGQYERAVEQLDLTLKLLHRDQDLTHNTMGRALLGLGRLDEAAEHLRLAVRINPDFVEAHNNLAVAYARQGDLNAALAEVREALRIDPAFAPALQNLQRMESKLHDFSAGPQAGLRPSADPNAPELAAGRRSVGQFYRGELEVLRGGFSEVFASQMSLEQLVEMRRTIARQLGREIELLQERVATRGSSRVYVRRARFERYAGDVEVMVQLGADGSVWGLVFQPAEDDRPG